MLINFGLLGLIDLQNGRDGLMCSLNPEGWIKICEMLLEPAPEDFEFGPKVNIIPCALLCASDAADCFILS